MNFAPALITEIEPFELKGELPAEALALNDAAVRATKPVRVEVVVAKDEDGSFVVAGWAQTELALVCGRCAEWFPLPVRAKVEHVFEGPQPSSIDLTPYLREDILLELPLNAVCRLGADGRCPVTGELYQSLPETPGSSPVGEEVWEALSKIKPKD